MTPILNGNLFIRSIHLKVKKETIPSIFLGPHIPYRMDPSQTPGRPEQLPETLYREAGGGGGARERRSSLQIQMIYHNLNANEEDIQIYM